VYQSGHYGASLLVYAPLGFALHWLGEPVLAVLGGVISLSLATLPDVDTRLPLVSHRGVTHTVLFAVAVGAVLGAVGWAVGTLGGSGGETAVRLAAFGAVVGTTAIGSHLLADVITPMGLVPFWPLSRAEYTLDITRADNRVANAALLVLGVLVAALTVLLAEPSLLWLFR